MKKRITIIVAIMLLVLTLCISMMACIDEDEKEYQEECNANFKELTKYFVEAKNKDGSAERKFKDEEGDEYVMTVSGNKEIKLSVTENGKQNINGTLYDNTYKGEISFTYGSGDEKGFKMTIKIYTKLPEYDNETLDIKYTEKTIMDNEAAFFLDQWKVSSFPEDNEYKASFEKIGLQLINTLYDYTRTKCNIELWEKPSIMDMIGGIL